MGAHRASGDGASDGSASRPRFGKNTPERVTEERMPRRSTRPSRPGSAWGAVKHALHPFAPFARRRWGTAVSSQDAPACGSHPDRLGARLDTGVDGRRWLHVPLAGLRLRSRKRARKAGTARSERSLRGRVGPNLGIASRRGPRRAHGLVAKDARSCRRTTRETDPATNGCTGTRGGITAAHELPPRWPRERSTRATRRKASRRGARGLSPSPRVTRLAVCGSRCGRARHGAPSGRSVWSRTITP